ncbi:MAG: sigma-70 family RNA polymerase sigma factor [Flavobacteriales bacterium]|nr:sigma-70 family RNA polymerase sigma factor [Flavobacteriales bacterium]
MEEYSDNELLEQFRVEDSRHYAFNKIVRKHQEKLYWHIRRMVLDHDDADDVLQNTWIKAWKGLDNFRADANLYTWLYRIATNETITFLTNKKKRFFVPIADVEHELASNLESDNFYTGDEIQKRLQKAILTLPEKQRLVFNMKYFDEMKYNQMSEVLDTSVGALKASYHHAVKKIEEQLTNTE